jgi:hypothetical protein
MSLGLSPQLWHEFLNSLSDDDRLLLEMKQAGNADQAIAKQVRCTPKQVQKRWAKLLDAAWQVRNQAKAA